MKKLPQLPPPDITLYPEEQLTVRSEPVPEFSTTSKPISTHPANVAVDVAPLKAESPKAVKLDTVTLPEKVLSPLNVCVEAIYAIPAGAGTPVRLEPSPTK
jgi:hypothetical protein